MSNVVIAGTPPSGDTALPIAASIDGVNDYLPIYTASATATQAINRQTLLGVTGQPADISSVQTMTNKTLSSPTISNPSLSGTITGSYIIAGNPTFPSNVVTLTGAQTLSNKTINGGTISSAIISNPTLTVDSINGFTTSTTGTIYGISITGGNTISTPLTLTGLLTASDGLTVSGTVTLPSSSVTSVSLYNPYKFRVTRNNAATSSAGVFTIVNFDTKSYDTSSNVDIVTHVGRFTAPIAAFYHFDACINMATSSSSAVLSLYKNGSEVTRGTRDTANAGLLGVIVSDTLQLAINDYVEVYTYNSSTLNLDIQAGIANYFSGYLVSAT